MSKHVIQIEVSEELDEQIKAFARIQRESVKVYILRAVLAFVECDRDNSAWGPSPECLKEKNFLADDTEQAGLRLKL